MAVMVNVVALSQDFASTSRSNFTNIALKFLRQFRVDLSARWPLAQGAAEDGSEPWLLDAAPHTCWNKGEN